MAKLKMLGSRVATLDTSIAKPPPKVGAAVLLDEGDCTMSKPRYAYCIRSRRRNDETFFDSDSGHIIDVEEIVVGGRWKTVIEAKDGTVYRGLDWSQKARDLWDATHRPTEQT
jgi:hypothetical protein